MFRILQIRTSLAPNAVNWCGTKAEIKLESSPQFPPFNPMIFLFLFLGNQGGRAYLAVGTAKATDVGAVVVVMASVVLGVLEGELDLSEHEVIRLVLGGVSAEDHFLDGVVLAGRLFAVGKPFDGERRPLEGVGDDQIVEEGGVLLPYLVLLVYQPLLYLSPHLLLVLSHSLSVSLSLCACFSRSLSREFFSQRSQGLEWVFVPAKNLGACDGPKKGVDSQSETLERSLESDCCWGNKGAAPDIGRDDGSNLFFCILFARFS